MAASFRKVLLLLNSLTSSKEASDFIMKDWSIFSKFDHNGAYLPMLPIDSPISHDVGLGLISQVGNLVECSFQHPRHICATGSGTVQEAFSCLNKFAEAFYFWFSRASNPKLFQRLSAAAGSSSRVCRSHIKQVASCLQHLPGLQFGSQLRKDHAVQMLLARLASTTFGRLWTEVEEHHACNILMLAAATVVPPFENISPKMLAESMALRKDGGNIPCWTVILGRNPSRLCVCCCAKSTLARRCNRTENWHQVPHST
ncbi:Fatty-acid-binding protein 2 [Zea mays]|uniref:Fatty-acid-binding protein 2 n=1 Tax=Zea mays TaxID=4577 RepID=A0A1D6QDB9_MAIZE|nr:Fatty-acid-binding protein 2 [Zea mays]